MPFRSDDREELDDREWPEPTNIDEVANDDTTPCPFCQAAVYEDSERCPHCGNYLFAKPAGPRGKPWWIIAGVVLSLIVVIYWLWPA